jgi:hypothetical protein
VGLDAHCNRRGIESVIGSMLRGLRAGSVRKNECDLNAVTVRFAAYSVAALLAACGSQSATTERPPSTPKATNQPSIAATPRSASPMFAVLETHRTCPQGCNQGQAHDTVAIARADGYAVAKATFAPRSVPGQFDAATVMQPEAYVAAAAVYYADGSGVVRRLDPTGKIGAVATFPLTSPEQELSFAVSPDGSQLMAARLTFPRLVGGLPPTPVGNWMLDIMRAPAGGATTQVQHWQAGSFPGSAGGFSTIFVVGWDSTGPIGLIGANFGTQQGQFDGQRFFGGRLAYLDTNGHVGTTIGGSDCSPFAPPMAGRVICANNSGQSISVSVRAVDGHQIWSGQAPNPPSNFGGGFVLSADGQRLAMDGEVVTLASGATVTLPPSFTPGAWLGTTDLIGTTQGGQSLAVVHMSAAPSLENWGFSGQIVGDLFR